MASQLSQLLAPEKKWYEELEDQCPTLTYKQRIVGCVCCLVVGFLLSLGSIFRIEALLKGNPVPFAVFYSIGNLVALFGTLFLAGPVTQIKNMFKPERVGATVLFLGSLFFTLFCAFYTDMPKRVPLLLMSVAVQFASLIWYTLSYIPFAQRACVTCSKNLCCSNSEL